MEMDGVTWDFRRYTAMTEPEPYPVSEVGDPVYGMTTDGEPFTLYVTEVNEDGSIRIGADKP